MAKMKAPADAVEKGDRIDGWLVTGKILLPDFMPCPSGRAGAFVPTHYGFVLLSTERVYWQARDEKITQYKRIWYPSGEEVTIERD